MIYLEGKITGGNLSESEISLTGDTELFGVNVSRSRIDKGIYTLITTDCNTHGLRTKTLSGDWVKIDTLTVPIEEEFLLASEIRAIIRGSTGSYGVDAWDFSLETLLDNPTMSETQWEAKALAWKNKEAESEFEDRPGKINATDPVAALDLLVEWLVEKELMVQPANNFEGIAALIRAHDFEAWTTGHKVAGDWV
jgi:hypothetical protein